jgi:hypothetical protein
MFAITRIRTLRFAAAVALGASIALVAVPPAEAAVGDIVCTPPSGSMTTYSPALTTSPQNVSVTAQILLSSCLSTTVPAITSGSTPLTTFAVPNRSCLNLTGSSAVTATITWNTGQTSTVSFTHLVNIVGAVYSSTLTGTVTSGLFAGDTVIGEQLGAATDIVLCTLGLGTVSTIATTTTLTFA